MRSFAFIMTLVLLTLTFEPAISALLTKESVDTACCDRCCKPTEDKQDDQNQEGDNDKSCDSNCNPFQSCSTCLGFIADYPKINFTARPPISRELSLLTLQMKPQFYPDFWQPPKIA